MAVLVDSSVLIDLERRQSNMSSLRDILGGQPTAMSAITASELLYGMHRAIDAARGERRRIVVEAFLAEAKVIPFDIFVARRDARLQAELVGSGSLIGAHDLIIAATAIAHDLVLLTLDQRHFGRVPGLRLLDRSTG